MYHLVSVTQVVTHVTPTHVTHVTCLSSETARKFIRAYNSSSAWFFYTCRFSPCPASVIVKGPTEEKIKLFLLMLMSVLDPLQLIAHNDLESSFTQSTNAHWTYKVFAFLKLKLAILKLNSCDREPYLKM